MKEEHQWWLDTDRRWRMGENDVVPEPDGIGERGARVASGPPGNMARLRECLWLGVTVENQATADERLPLLRDLEWDATWVSVEPMLGPVCVEHVTPMEKLQLGNAEMRTWQGGDWVVCGCESGPGARPFDGQWARDLRDQCQAWSILFYYKQAPDPSRRGSVIKHPELDGRQWDEVLAFLTTHNACNEAVEWVREHGGPLSALWADCPESEWMIWLLEHIEGTSSVLRWFAAQCARHVLPIWESAHPDDDRPRRAIEVAERYAHGRATRDELAAAWDAAWAAAGVAARGAAWGAAGAAAGAAAWGAARDAAGDAARDAAKDAARAADIWDADIWDAERAWQRGELRRFVTVAEALGVKADD
jgi:hypothetical protein